MLACGCAHFYERFVTAPDFKEADDFVRKGNYNASLLKYEQIVVQYPLVGDRVLFEMGILYAFPGNHQKDYQKSLDCFQKLIQDYPESRYRKNSEGIISLIYEVISRDKRVMVQKKQIDNLEQKVEELEKKIEQMKNVDMNLIQKKKPFH
jgi:tetratricopeptide (TPR) repeat protein